MSAPGPYGEPEIDVSGRPLRLRALDLDRFFSPATVAVVGATDTVGKPGRLVCRRLLDWAEAKGVTTYLVNPGRAEIFGRPTHPSLSDVPGDIDVVVLLVSDLAPAVKEAAAKGVRYGVIFAAGFAEVGAEGAAAQEELVRLAAAGGMHLLGPNTNLNAFEQFRTDLDGPAIGLVTQSGHQGRPVFQAQELGIRVSHWAPTGNEADLEAADFVAYLADRPEVGVVAAYAEGFRDGRTFLLAADHAARAGVPIVLLKSGRTAVGADMVSSHTGKLAGNDVVTSAVLRQYGVTRVDALDQLIDTAQVLARARPPTTDGVAVMAISGGTSANMADLCALAGLRLPRLSDETQRRLYEWIPGYLRVSNPVDNGGQVVGDERGRLIIDTVLADDGVGVLVVPITGAFAPMSDVLAQHLVDAAEATDKLICVVWGSPAADEDAYRRVLLGSRRLAVFRTFGNCARAVRAYLDHHAFRARYRSPFELVPREQSAAAARARPLLARVDRPTEQTAKELLALYGVAAPAEVLARSESEVVDAAARVGFPVVLKAVAPGLAHKSELGLVETAIDGESACRAAYRRIVGAADRAGVGELAGVLVAEQVTDGVEMVVGLVDDSVFGPTVMVGTGGVMVELIGDVTFRVPPFDADEVHRMLAELAGRPLLDGYRGAPAADVDALVEVVLAVARLGLELSGTVRELEINPLLVRPAGKGAVALDALVVLDDGASTEGLRHE